LGEVRILEDERKRWKMRERGEGEESHKWVSYVPLFGRVSIKVIFRTATSSKFNEISEACH
jgi:hypothetical protein